MSTSVKMADQTKSRLEELQAEIKLATGKKVTQQELLDRIVDRAYESKDDLVEAFRPDDEWQGLQEDEIERWLSGTTDWGIETDEDEIDDILYGKADSSEESEG